MSRRTPLVSVIIPTYNRPDRLKRCLKSVADQIYDEIEIMVIDDGSEIHAEEIVAPIRDRLPYETVVVRHNENRGANAARNTGIREASGEFLAFLDDDDEWEPAKVSRQIECFQQAADGVGLVYTATRIVDDGELVRTTDASARGNVFRQLLCRNVIGSFSCVMVRSTAVDDSGLLDEAFHSWQDLDWYIRISKRWTVQPIAEPLVTNHVGAHDRISDDLETLVEETYPRFVEKHRPCAAKYGWLFDRKMRAWAAFRIGAWYALPGGWYGRARQFILRALVLYPLNPYFFLYAIIALGGDPIARGFEWVKRFRRR